MEDYMQFFKEFEENYPEVISDCYTYYNKTEVKARINDIIEFYFWCQQYGLQPDYKFGYIYVKSCHLDRWRFVPTSGKIELMHGNRYFKDIGDYHLQFCKKMTMKELAIYMSEHDRAKYTPEFVKFSF